ncbi:hypothetical protein [Thalassotalea agarivorans]|uniref:Lipoprotein n=1 Tax=Thalassotalea agarivorans TaxID=349064 RepID=A0A1H9Y9Y8_THASX|nr:hypothetical protein [Thalassotalea agarivorans]SES65609.1 hypothetical protein SAMN05660429_00136 [Thalassotalea agarivorans]
MKKIVALVITALLSACASEPYAIIDGSKSNPADDQNVDVYITGIDGQRYFDDRKWDTLTPGHHDIQFTSSKADKNGNYRYTSVPLVLKPCVRYSVSAQHASALRYDNKEWKIVIEEKPIKSCESLIKETPQNADVEQTTAP